MVRIDNLFRLRITTIAATATTAIFVVACNAQDLDEQKQSSGDTVTINGERFTLSTRSESLERLTKFPELRATEDASALLVRPKLPRISRDDPSEAEYLPEAAVSWVVDITFPSGAPIDTAALAALRTKSARTALGDVTAYALDADTHKWTYLISAEGPKRVAGLKYAWEYFSALTPDVIPNAAAYRKRLRVLTDLVRRCVPATTIAADVTADVAAERSRKSADIFRRYDEMIIVRVLAPSGSTFDGVQMWDALSSLGLEWGDGDLFHWRNDSGPGDESFFMVGTSTEPTYFLPEEIAAGNMMPQDVAFAFFVPRCAAPEEVFTAMAAAAEYTRKRLGGTIVDASGKPLDPAAMRAHIRDVVRELTALGLAPGSDAALQLF